MGSSLGGVTPFFNAKLKAPYNLYPYTTFTLP